MSEAVSLNSLKRKHLRQPMATGSGTSPGVFPPDVAVAPPAQREPGDFWSSVVFLPFWGLVYLAVRLLRTRVVAPRVGPSNSGARARPN